MHYARWQRHGDTATTLRPRVEGPCAIDGCDAPARARSWCNPHWKRWNRYGDPTATAPTKAPTTCAETGCDKLAKAAGRCGACYARARRAQAPKPDQPERRCLICESDMTGRRKDATLCSTACRNAARSRIGRQAPTVRCTIVENEQQCTNEATRRLKTDVWCRKHHARYERHGDPLAVLAEQRPKGDVQADLRRAATATTDDCILLPSPAGGRLSVSTDGCPMTAARAVWTIANGAPGDRHVLHTCHKGDDGCINIRHLYLGDHARNMLDMVQAGRSTRGERSGRAVLKEGAVREIRQRYRAGGVTQKALADEHGVAPSTISLAVAGRSWGWLDG